MCFIIWTLVCARGLVPGAHLWTPWGFCNLFTLGEIVKRSFCNVGPKVAVVILPHRRWMVETELETFDLKVIKSLTMKALWDPGDLRNNIWIYEVIIYEVPNPDWGPRGNFEKSPVVSNASYIYRLPLWWWLCRLVEKRTKIREIQYLRTLNI